MEWKSKKSARTVTFDLHTWFKVTTKKHFYVYCEQDRAMGREQIAKIRNFNEVLYILALWPRNIVESHCTTFEQWHTHGKVWAKTMILHIIMVWSLSYRNLVHGQFTLFTYMHSGWKVRVRLDQVENSQVVSDGRTDGRTHHSRALYIINYIVNSAACVDAH